MIFDVGITCYAWIGKGASKQERAKGIQTATEYLKNNGRPAHIAVIRVLDGSEPSSFWTFFS